MMGTTLYLHLLLIVFDLLANYTWGCGGSGAKVRDLHLHLRSLLIGLTEQCAQLCLNAICAGHPVHKIGHLPALYLHVSIPHFLKSQTPLNPNAIATQPSHRMKSSHAPLTPHNSIPIPLATPSIPSTSSTPTLSPLRSPSPEPFPTTLLTRPSI